MKFNRILEQYVKESEALTKIMLKVDPANSVNRDYRDLDGYEGYILKESDNIWSVLFENIDIPIMDVPFSVIQVVDIPCDETFNSVKLLGLKAIEERKGLTMEIMSKIQACNSIDFLEQYLKEEGLNDSEIKDVYKKALLSSAVNESITDALWDGAKWVAKKSIPPEIFSLAAGLKDAKDNRGMPAKKVSPFYLDYAFQTAADDLKDKFNVRKRDSGDGDCVKIQRNFNASRKIKIDIRQGRDQTDDILNYFNTMKVCKEYLTYNEATGDIFKPEMRNGIIESIELCNQKYINTNSLDKVKVKSFFDNLGARGANDIRQSQQFSFFNNAKFRI